MDLGGCVVFVKFVGEVGDFFVVKFVIVGYVEDGFVGECVSDSGGGVFVDMDVFG